MTATNSNSRNVTLIGAPTDIGAGHRGGAMGPEALRVAGLETALRQMGLCVEDIGNLSGPVNPDTPPADGYRHLIETEQWCSAVRDACANALTNNCTPILMGGDHSLAIGSIAAVAHHCANEGIPLSVLWLDAHADFNTSGTSPSGNIHGMPVAVISGYGPDKLKNIGHGTPILDPAHITQVGIRSVDAIEKRMVVDSGMDVHDMRRIDERGMRRTMEDVLKHIKRRGGHLHVSFDVDFLDPSIAPGVGTTVKGGPNYREAQLCMEMISESGLMRSLDIMELNPAFDERNQSAELVVDLVKSLFGEQILARHSNFKQAV
jgi:arginase